MPRKSACSRSSSWSGARSCSVITTDMTSPSPPGMGVTLTSVVMLRPSGTEVTTSSARSVREPASAWGSVSSLSTISLPSEKRQVAVCTRSSAGRPAWSRPPARRRASRFIDTGRPLRASNTTTPTGEVSIRASRSARAPCSARWVRALATAEAACAANSASTSSSSPVNSGPVCFSPRKKLPTCTPRWCIGVPRKVLTITPSVLKPIEAIKVGRSATRRGEGTSRSASKTRRLSVHPSTCRLSSGVKPEVTASSRARASSMVTMTAKRAPVSARADSAISCSTVSTSRLALTRRMAEDSAAIRSRSAWISRSGWLLLLIGCSFASRNLTPAGPARQCSRQRAGGAPRGMSDPSGAGDNGKNTTIGGMDTLS